MNPSMVIVRTTQLSDLPSLVACLNPVFLERRYLAIVEAIPAPEATSYHAANIAAGYPHCVAVLGDRVVGLCDIVPAAPPRIAAQAHTGTLGVLLAPDARGYGIGERLLRATLAAGRDKFERIQLNVYSHNERAHRLYLRCGFVEEGRRRAAWKLDGMTSDIIDMGLLYSEQTA
ncbi:GNAT family N-acetyltransferase [Casimicrobium huifangae]|jgi:putative acetyltransferase|uniref:GNAT family N-acetyltransferase n=1 Tax=Casimicrobium huifangae TaxID=2591109 RepID=UPI0012EB2AE1|nr:GNAT family protein [Casimicrobium huifangae]